MPILDHVGIRVECKTQVISALGQTHRDATFASPSGAAAYAIHKRHHQRTEALCREAVVMRQSVMH